jgi:hypothetical protein
MLTVKRYDERKKYGIAKATKGVGKSRQLNIAMKNRKITGRLAHKQGNLTLFRDLEFFLGGNRFHHLIQRRPANAFCLPPDGSLMPL